MRQVLASALAAMVLAGCGVSRSPSQPHAVSLQTHVDRQDWKYPYGTGHRITSRHYRIFTSMDNPYLLARLPGFLEAAYAHYHTLSGLAERPEGRRMDVYMLASRQEWVALTKWRFGPRAPHLNIDAGGYCHDGVGVYWDLRRRDTLSIAAHEGFHQFFHHRLRHHLPTWLEEGLCVQAEGFHINGNAVTFFPAQSPARFNSLQEAIGQERWIPLEQLLVTDSTDLLSGFTEDTLRWYGQLWGLVLFLRSHPVYREGLMRMVRDAEAGRFHLAIKDAAGHSVPPEAIEDLQLRGHIYNGRVSRPLFEHYFTTDLAGFEREYYAFSRELVGLGKANPR